MVSREAILAQPGPAAPAPYSAPGSASSSEALSFFLSLPLLSSGGSGTETSGAGRPPGAATGAAEEGALFTYEALPRGTVLSWELTCRNPKHFKVEQDDVKDDVKAVGSPEGVKKVIADAWPYLEHLGIGGMGSRGMGRLRVLVEKKEGDR